MALVPVTELLLQANREGYAVGAFNANNMEIIQAIIALVLSERSVFFANFH
jgi:fructose-bisphosphate aldolase class II